MASAAEPSLAPAVGPAITPEGILATSTGINEQVIAQVNTVTKSDGQSKAKTARQKTRNTEQSAGGKRKHQPEQEDIEARPQKGNNVQTVGAVGATSVGQGRVTRARRGAGKKNAQADGPVPEDSVHKSTLTAAQPQPNPASTKTNKPGPKHRRTIVEEDPFETNEENNVSSDDLNKDGENSTSSNEEDRSDSEDGLGGDNVGDILTAEQPKWNPKATSAKGKGKAVDKNVKVPGWAKRALPAPITKTHCLKLDAIDISSGSEFEPEDNEDGDEDMEEEDEEERQAWAEFVAARAARGQNKPHPRPPTAREQVEVLCTFHAYAHHLISRFFFVYVLYQRPVWKKTTPTAGPASGPSATSLLPANIGPSTLVGPAFATTSVPISASTNEAGTFDEGGDDEEMENVFGPDDNVIGGLIRDPLAPAPIPQPIPPIVVPLLTPLLTAAMPAVNPQPLHINPQPVHINPQPLPANPPQADIPNVLPPQAYVIVPNATGGAPQLNPQHIHIVRTIRASIPRLELYLATEHAFPDSFVASQFISTTLVTSAANIGVTGLVARMQQTTDPDFLRVMIALTKQRISTFRSAVKKHADANVTAHHRLGSNPEKMQEKVTSLFQYLKYIYPYTEKDDQLSADWRKPYMHDCVTAVLRAAFTTGPNALLYQHPEILSSTHPNRPNEHEIPKVMLALVGTAPSSEKLRGAEGADTASSAPPSTPARQRRGPKWRGWQCWPAPPARQRQEVFLMLSDWKLGTHKPASFTADAYADAYKEHITLLDGIKDGNFKAYHKMMHMLYTQVTGTAAPAPAAGAPGAALAHVDIHGMDIDSD